MTDASAPPESFIPYAEPGPFLDRIGPLWQKRTDTGFAFGVRIAPYHCNRRGMAHGGLVITLADITLGKTGEWLSDPPVSLLTASLTVDLYSAARLDDWLEAETDVTRVGRRIAFGNCYLRVADRMIARASGIFNVRESSKAAAR